MEQEEESGSKRKNRRTQDSVKNIVILMAQFSILCGVDRFTANIENQHLRVIFSDEERINGLKRNFIKFATEELLRREFNQKASDIVGAMIPLLLHNHEQVIQDVMNRRGQEFAGAGKSSNDDAQLGQKIAQKLGYSEGNLDFDDEEFKSVDGLKNSKMSMDDEAKKIAKSSKFDSKPGK